MPRESRASLAAKGNIKFEKAIMDALITLASGTNPDGTPFTIAVEGGAGGGETGVTDTLLSTTTVDLNDGAAQDLYPVPADKVLIITRAIFRNASADLTSGDVETMTIRDSTLGFIIITRAVIGMIDNLRFGYSVPVTGRTIPAGDRAQFMVNVPYGSPVTLVVDLFGYLIDA